MNIYSTVNVATVVRDLARHPRGRALARDLLHAFAVDEHALVELDAVATAADVTARCEAALASAVIAPRAHAALAAARLDATESGLDGWFAALPVLESAPIGSLPELLRWLRADVLDGAWERTDDLAVARFPHALDVVADGVLGTWVGDPSVLSRPWRTWTTRRLPATVREPALAIVVAMVAEADATAVSAAATAMRAARASGWSWPLAVHDACWAIELTGRGRTAAVAQLEAVHALLGVVPQPAPDAVAAVVAAVHATAVADVLPADTVAAMCRPLLSALS